MQDAFGIERQNPAQRQHDPIQQQRQAPAVDPIIPLESPGNVLTQRAPPRRVSIRDLCESLQPGRLPSSDCPPPANTPPPSYHAGPSPGDVTHVSGPSVSPLSPRARRRQDEAAVRARFLSLHPPGFTFDRPLYERDMLDMMSEEEWMAAQEIWIAEAEEEERQRARDREQEARVDEPRRDVEAGVVTGTPGAGDTHEPPAPAVSDPPDGSARIASPQMPLGCDRGADGDVPPLFAAHGLITVPPACGSARPGLSGKRTASELQEDLDARSRQRPRTAAAGEDVAFAPDRTITTARAEVDTQADDDWTIIETEPDDLRTPSRAREPTPPLPSAREHLIDHEALVDLSSSSELAPPASPAAAAGPTSRLGGTGGSAEGDEDDFVIIGAVIRSRIPGYMDTRATTPTVDDEENWREEEAA